MQITHRKNWSQRQLLPFQNLFQVLVNSLFTCKLSCVLFVLDSTAQSFPYCESVTCKLFCLLFALAPPPQLLSQFLFVKVSPAKLSCVSFALAPISCFLFVEVSPAELPCLLFALSPHTLGESVIYELPFVHLCQSPLGESDPLPIVLDMIAIHILIINNCSRMLDKRWIFTDCVWDFIFIKETEGLRIFCIMS